MFIKIIKSPNGKYQKVYLIEGYRDKNKKIKHRIIERYGNLEELEKQDPNIIAKLKSQAKAMTKKPEIRIVDFQRKTINEAESYVNYGYLFLEKIYQNLGIKQYLDKASKKYQFQYDLNSIFKMLVYNRILSPSSKLKAFQDQHKYFEPFNNKLEDVYRSLTKLDLVKDEIQKIIHEHISNNYGHDASLVLYDLTNYYFEIEREDELKKKGVSKENKPNPIVQMGLWIDKNKIPMGYQLFPDNTHDSKTTIPMISKLKKQFGVGHVILTADKGINSAYNFSTLAKQGDGYIVSKKIRGSNKDFINQVLDENNYMYWGSDFKYKEIIQKRVVVGPGKTKVELHEKIIIYWSKDFDTRMKYKREKLNDKIAKFINSPSSLTASNKHGVKRYVTTHHIDKKDGSVHKINPLNTFEQKKYDRDVALDEYYCIITSEIKKSVKEILAHYHQLWTIEESFRIMKSELKGRPVYVQRNDRIEGHFLVCFVALTMLRILEMQTNYKYSAKQIKLALKQATCQPHEKGIYIMQPQSEIIRHLENNANAYLHYKINRFEEIKRYKKEIVYNKK